MNKNIENKFNEQINEEMYSAYLYLAMSAHFEDKGLKGAASWMKQQAMEEMSHAMKFYGHIVERGGRVELDEIKKPTGEFKSTLGIFEESLKHEKHITGKIRNLVELAEKENDYESRTMLQWFIDEQVEEEQSVQDVIDKLKMIKDAPGAMFMLDAQLARRGQEKK